jgi:tRNA modification GTPase
MTNFDTICALATANGVGALGIIRVSGNEAFTKVNEIFKGKNLEKVASHTVHYGHIISQQEEIIDEVMVAIFHAPKTFTTENLVEIFCHGSPYIQQKIVELLLENGTRLANAGEFTQRAFLGGRIDLSQAEAVADVIASENKASHELAINQMRGGFSSELKNLREELINCTALVELELDFSEEDVDFIDKNHLMGLIETIDSKIKPLIESFAYGNAIKNGVPVAIVGKPNAGKSSLLNVLLNENRAIVSAIPGTTRDTIEEQIVIEGINFRFIDTAGIRETSDEIESLGIEKTFEKARQSAVILYLFDKENTAMEEVISDFNLLKTKHNEILICPTKTDLYPTFDWCEWLDFLKPKTNNAPIIGVSTKTKSNIDLLKRELAAPYLEIKQKQGNSIVVNQRHLQELKQASAALQEATTGLKTGLSGDLIAFHLRDAIKSIGNITGAIEIDRDILGTIFGKFCIGK